MPELPEVETTKRGIAPFVLHQTLLDIVVRQPKLRLPVPNNMHQLIVGKSIIDVTRRGKYILLHLSEGTLLIHLGMSGHLRLVPINTPHEKHDHIDLVLANDKVLRYTDPRRFGLFIYIQGNPLLHPLLTHLGPEPLTHAFNAEYLISRAQGKSQCIKSFIMTNQVVVGVGNIYAAESLFLARVHPQMAAGAVTKRRLTQLTSTIKDVLQQAIHAGGTTLRDFYSFDGKPGYFSIQLKVYGRQNLPCYVCESVIEAITIGGRKSAFCPQCQALS